MSVLEMQAVQAAYGRTPVLHDIDLRLEEGELLAILGPSGCGKTTLLRTIAGLHPINGGRIILHGRIIDGSGKCVRPERRGIGMVPQDGALFPHLDVSANIAFGLVRPTWSSLVAGRGERRTRVAEMLRLIDMAEYHSARPSELSGGQQQRVALARAFAPHPELILMDEPFAALDTQLRESIRAEVRALLKAQSATSILVTHDRAEALGIADRIAVVIGGRIAQIDTPRRIYRSPKTADVGLMVGDGAVFDAHANGRRAICQFGTADLQAGENGPGQVLIRPEQWRVTRDEQGPFTVTDTCFLGPVTSLTALHHPTGTAVTAELSSEHPADYRVGERVEMTVTGTAPFFAKPG